MKLAAVSAVVLTIFLTVAGCTSQRYAQYHRGRPPVDTLAAMKMQDVISLTKAGVSDTLIMTMLATSHSWFQLKTQDVLDLKNAGVSERVINAMMLSNEPPTEGDRYAQDEYYYYPASVLVSGLLPCTGTIRRFISATVITGRSIIPGLHTSAATGIAAAGAAVFAIADNEGFFRHTEAPHFIPI